MDSRFTALFVCLVYVAWGGLAVWYENQNPDIASQMQIRHDWNWNCRVVSEEVLLLSTVGSTISIPRGNYVAIECKEGLVQIKGLDGVFRSIEPGLPISLSSREFVLRSVGKPTEVRVTIKEVVPSHP